MKTIWIYILTAIVLGLSAFGVHAQGTFQNLDFESPITPLVGAGFPPTVPITNALPGWVGYVGTNLATRVRIDGVNLDNATLALISSNIVDPRIIPLIQGSYTAVLQVGLDPRDPLHSTSLPVSLAQSSLVPVGSLSLRFLGYTVGTPFAVTLGGVNIPVSVLQSFPTYKLYGGDISAFGGSIAELRFTAFPDNYPHSVIFAVDSIAFSPEAIPEPSAFGLFAVGALLLGSRRFSKRR